MKLALLSAAWLVGLALAHRWYDADPTPVLLLALAALTLALICRLLRPLHPAVSPWPALLVCVLLLGVWRYEASQAVPPLLIAEEAGSAALQGRIVTDPEALATRVRFQLEVESIRSGWAQPDDAGFRPMSGKVLVYAYPPDTMVLERERPYFRYGDRLQLTGRLQQPQPFNDFDYPAYLESLGIYAVLWPREVVWLEPEAGAGLGTSLRAGIYDVRRRLARSLTAALPPEPAALAQALLLGQRGQLTDAVIDNFRQTGTSHLLAISGLHLGILLAMTLGLLQRLLGRRSLRAVALTLALIWLYVLLSGAPASVVRAAIMGSVYLAAGALGRPRESLLPSLALSALAMTALQPDVVTRISFQLSFAAMAGIALVLPWQAAAAARAAAAVSRRYGNERTWAALAGVALGWLVSGSLVSLAATLATFPLVAVNFNHLPLLGIPATLLATPLLPFALAGGLAAALAGLVHPTLGQAVGLLAAVPLTALLELTARFPGWALSGAWVDYRLAWVWYGLLLTALLLERWLRSSTRWGKWFSSSGSQGTVPDGIDSYAEGRRRAAPYLALAGAGLFAAGAVIYLLSGALGGPGGRLHVYFFDVGQGDSFLIVTPGGRQALVDGGADVNGAARAIADRLPPWDRSLDLVAATHFDADHSRGLLPVLDNYRVKMVAAGLPDPQSALFTQWQQAASGNGHNVIYLRAGQSIHLDEGITLETLHPPAAPRRGAAWDSNNNSLVLRLTYGEISFLLTGDIEAEAERYLIRTAPTLQADILKAGHHGSNSSTTAPFLRAVNPRWAVISAGPDNQYGHPHPETLARLAEAVGEEGIFSTARQGTIKFSTDGQRLWVETER